MKVDLVFHDWLQGTGLASIYFSKAGVALTAGDFHHGTTFEAEVIIEEEEDLVKWLQQGFVPVFSAHLPKPAKPEDVEPPHKHLEAFMLMRYRCEGCDHSEMFWNSRDGITPLGYPCPECAGDMIHVDWDEDCYAPEHFPLTGQGVWVDMPDSLKVVLARSLAYSFEGPEEQREAFIDTIVRGFPPGTPWLIRWS